MYKKGSRRNRRGNNDRMVGITGRHQKYATDTQSHNSWANGCLFGLIIVIAAGCGGEGDWTEELDDNVSRDTASFGFQFRIRHRRPSRFNKFGLNIQDTTVRDPRVPYCAGVKPHVGFRPLGGDAHRLSVNNFQKWASLVSYSSTHRKWFHRRVLENPDFAVERLGGDLYAASSVVRGMGYSGEWSIQLQDVCWDRAASRYRWPMTSYLYLKCENGKCVRD